MIVTLAGLAIFVLGSWWLVHYVRTRDAEEATSGVASGVFGLFVVAFGSAVVVLQQGAVALSLIGDQVAVHASWLAYGALSGIGFFAFTYELMLDPRTWLAIAGSVLVGAIMVRR